MSHVDELEYLSPKSRVMAGVGILALGAVISWTAWDAGSSRWVEFVIFLVAGATLIGSGWAGIRRQRAEEAQWELVRHDEAALIARLVEVKRKGGRTVPWLIQNGITNRKVRNYLLELADEE